MASINIKEMCASVLKGRRSRIWLAIVALLAVAGVVLYFVLRSKPAPAAMPVVEVEPVESRSVNIYGEYVGRIRAQQFVEIRARVEGYLEKMFFEEGTYVDKGRTLFIIDQKVYKALAEKARAQLNKARANAQKAERDLARIRP
ncbi:MAG: biotin/lipoyl-binding protein, partial [Muribaculaceae bacterium]|nr:biotin/lipoyl-binding protein [Muribaculaceae bacterium]